MKKLLIVFGILGFFFAGFVMAESTSICEGINPDLKRICEKAVEAGNAAEKWLSEKDPSLTVNIDKTIKEQDKEIEKNDKKRGTKEFLKGNLRIKLIEADTDNTKYSDYQKEKMFIEAVEFFQQAEKIERKPVILSGGILPGPGDTEDGTEYMVNKFITKFVNGSLIFLFSLGTLMLIIGGIMFLVSSGDSEILTKAKDTIFWGIVGITLAVMSYAIVKFVVGLDFGL
jgi:hypothetical protein